MISNTPPSSQSSGNTLSHFLYAQESIYGDVLRELRAGRKRSHWMWFIFPQLTGLGQSATSRYYAISSLAEAEAYLHHPVLGLRLVECAQAVFAIEGKSVAEIFGHPDDIKLKSSMTLFSMVSGADPIFRKVLEKYFSGEPDIRTLQLLGPPTT